MAANASTDAPANTPNQGPVEPSENDKKFFATTFKYLPNDLEMDWDQLAAEMGLKNGHIAKVRFRQIRRKLSIKSTETSMLKPLKPSKVTKRAKATKTQKQVKDDLEDDEEDLKVFKKTEDDKGAVKTDDAEDAAKEEK
ncbi:hypothetical protein F4819DRAFT_484263 [Hypoxylon fuscum]|nr:hypothetical protein F4819DRAFT_484263 [Hypoxylon fuscum]